MGGPSVPAGKEEVIGLTGKHKFHLTGKTVSYVNPKIKKKW